MRSLLQTNKHARGFTLVEVLIISPIVILAIGGFVALMVTMVSDVLVTRDESALTYEAQSALDRIEQDVRLSTQFLNTTDALSEPQGSNNNFTGTAAFTNTSNSLLLSTLATDKNPASAERWLTYYDNQPNSCEGDEQFNRVLQTKIIYFIKDGSLWRRSVVPNWNTDQDNNETVCSSVWQLNSCSPGYTAARCQTDDEKLMDNITSLNVEYFASPSSDTNLGASGATNATSVNVTINSQKTTAGNVITDSSNVRVTKLNDIDTTKTPPAAPAVSHSLVTPETVEFTWPSVAEADSYLIGYKINSGEWVTQTLDSNATSYQVTGVRSDVVAFRVAAFNTAGLSAYATDSQTLPAWGTFTLQNNWVYYGSSYNTPEFTKTSSGRVFLKGLVKSGTETTGTVIATLPEGYRPDETLVFPAMSSSSTAGRIDVLSNGNVIIYYGSNGWISLDNISFLPSTTPYTWNAVSFSNGWSNWGGSYEDVHITLDNLGRANLQGLARAGTQTSNTAIAYPSGDTTPYRPPKTLHLPAGANGFGFFWIWYSDSEITKRGNQTSSYLGLQALWYPGTVGSWSTPTFQNGWSNYGGNYPTLQYTKASDGVVTIRGLVKGGTATSGTVIANLPSGYRPPATELLATSSNNDLGRVDVTAAGNILFRNGTNSWFAINVSYISDQ
jgi:Tfp pilus assembly protein PilE